MLFKRQNIRLIKRKARIQSNQVISITNIRNQTRIEPKQGSFEKTVISGVQS